MSRRRLVIYGLIGLAVILAIAFGLFDRSLTVDAVAVTKGPLDIAIEEEGKTRVKDRFVVSAPVDATDRRVELEVGDPVEEDQVLVILEPRSSNPLDPRSRAIARERVDVAEAARIAAEEKTNAAAAEAERARVQYERTRDEYATGSKMKEELDQAAAEHRRTEARRRSAEFDAKVALHELHQARATLDYLLAEHRGEDVPETIELKSPAAGRVLAVHGESAGPVGVGEALVEIGDPSALEVAVDVLSLHAVRIEPGMSVRFERWGGAPLDGRVRVVEPTGFTKTSALGVEEQRVWVICDITSPRADWRRLGDGYRVEARFLVWSAPEVLRVPESALFRHGEGWAAYTIDDDRARLRPLGIGHRNGVTAEVLSGLAGGDRVITHPSRELEDGSKIDLRR